MIRRRSVIGGLMIGRFCPAWGWGKMQTMERWR